VQEFAVAKRKTSETSVNHFTLPMQTETSRVVNVSALLRSSSRLRDAGVAERFTFRQGLWIEDLRIPPGQECSNGSLIFIAVVLWRTFCLRAQLKLTLRQVEGDAPISHEL
jgi:hypothetical protein